MTFTESKIYTRDNVRKETQESIKFYRRNFVNVIKIRKYKTKSMLLQLKISENVASDEAGHFMMITEYQFKNTNTKNRDALTRFSEQITTTAPYESRNAFALYLPKGSLKHNILASHEKVDFGF